MSKNGKAREDRFWADLLYLLYTLCKTSPRCAMSNLAAGIQKWWTNFPAKSGGSSQKLRRCRTRLVCGWKRLQLLCDSFLLFLLQLLISCARPNSKRRGNTSRPGPWRWSISGHPVAAFHVEAAMRHLAKRNNRKFAHSWGHSSNHSSNSCFLPSIHGAKSYNQMISTVSQLVHPEVVYHRNVKLPIISHRFLESFAAVRRTMDWEDAFPMGAQDVDLIGRVQMLGFGHYQKVCLGSWEIDTACRFAKRTLFDKKLAFCHLFSCGYEERPQVWKKKRAKSYFR